MSQKQPEKIEVFHRINRMKKKVVPHGNMEAPGFINPQHIKNAQTVIDKSEESYKHEVAQTLQKLDAEWETVKKSSGTGKESTKEIHRLANYIKDMASTYQYELMEYFGHSLREFSDRIDMANKAHHTIVQAHIDVMQVAYSQNIKGQGGEMAKELKLIVGKAIDKYSAEN